MIYCLAVERVNSLNPNGDKHLISAYNIPKHTGHKNKGNDEQTQKVLMFVQILPTKTIKKYMENAKENTYIDIGAWLNCVSVQDF